MKQNDLEIRTRQADFYREMFEVFREKSGNPFYTKKDFAQDLGFTPMTTSRTVPDKGPSLTRLSIDYVVLASRVVGPTAFDASGYPRLEMQDEEYQETTEPLRTRWRNLSPETRKALKQNILDTIEQEQSARPAHQAAEMVPA